MLSDSGVRCSPGEFGKKQVIVAITQGGEGRRAHRSLTRQELWRHCLIDLLGEVQMADVPYEGSAISSVKRICLLFPLGSDHSVAIFDSACFTNAVC